MSDAPPEPGTEPTASPAPAAPAKRGRKPAAPKVVDTRPLAERVEEALRRLVATDAIIRAENRKIERCQIDVDDAHNRAAVARAAIRTREAGLKQRAVKIIQKETGIRTIPGYSQPKGDRGRGLSAWLLAKKETQARVRAAALAVMQADNLAARTATTPDDPLRTPPVPLHPPGA